MRQDQGALRSGAACEIGIICVKLSIKALGFDCFLAANSFCTDKFPEKHLYLCSLIQIIIRNGSDV